MFDDIADRAGSLHDQRQRWRMNPEDNARHITFTVLSIGVLCSGLVELCDELRDLRNEAELHHAHQENLIERVYELEGGDEREVQHPR